MIPGLKDNFFILLFSVLFIIHYAEGQDRKGLLWEISGKNLSRPSYLFGTIHLLCPDQLNISDSVIRAITSTDQLILEINFSDPTNPRRIGEGMKVKKAGEKLTHFLSHSDYEFLISFFRDSLNLSFGSIDNVKPMFLLTLLIPRAMNCQAVSVESKLTDLAGMYHRNIIGLETVEEQIEYINKISPREQTTMLLQSVKNYSGTKQDYRQMVSLYQNHEIDKLFNFIEKENSDFKNLTQTLVFNRNKIWTAEIENNISKKPSFIAVGAGHLGGKNGLITLLEEKGYRLRSIE